MFKTKLPLDYTRCQGSVCSERSTCLRYITIDADERITEPVRSSYSDMICWFTTGVLSYKYKIEGIKPFNEMKLVIEMENV